MAIEDESTAGCVAPVLPSRAMVPPEGEIDFGELEPV